MNKDFIRKRILLKLRWFNCWNEKHTAFENAYSGFPGHLRGAAKKEVKKLIKEGFLIAKPTNYGLQVSLNEDKSKEIKEFLKDYVS